MTKSRKTVIFIALALFTCALAGCMWTGNQPEPTPMPLASVGPDANGLVPMETNNGQMPVGTMEPGASLTPGTNAAERYDWQTKGALVEGRINLFSEIAESRVVVDGTTALVGVKFASQYKGELTQRVRDMIAGEIMGADNTIQVVAVTADPTDVAAIYKLSDELKGGMDQAQASGEIERIVRNATTLR